MIRPYINFHGHGYGLCNQLGFIFWGFEEAKKRNLKEVTIGCFNKDIYKPSFISTNKIFDFSDLPLDGLKINYELELPTHHTSDFAMQFSFNIEYCKKFKFSEEIIKSATEIYQTLPSCSAVIHSKLEQDCFQLRENHGGDKIKYEEDMIAQYQNIIDKLPEGNFIILCNEIHSFWKNNPRCIFPLKMDVNREINAAIEMCLCIKILNDLNVELVKTAGSTWDYVMSFKIGNNKTHIVNI